MMLSSPAASSAFDSSPIKPDESYCTAWYAFRTADLREIEKRKDSGFPHGGIQQVLRTYNVTVSRRPDLSNLAPTQQYLQLSAIKEHHIDTAVRTLAEMGAPASKATEATLKTKTAPIKPLQQNKRDPATDMNSTDKVISPGLLGHPKWTPKKVAAAEFVPRSHHVSSMIETPTPHSRTIDPVKSSSSIPTSNKLPPHLKARQQRLEEDAQVSVDQINSSQSDASHTIKHLSIQLDPRLRSNTIEFEPVIKRVGGSSTDTRTERSSSSPPKVLYSQIARPIGASKNHWNPSWYGSARTASGESVDKPPPPPVRKPVKLTKLDGTPILPVVYKVPQRRSEDSVQDKSGSRVETSSTGKLSEVSEKAKLQYHASPEIEATSMHHHPDAVAAPTQAEPYSVDTTERYTGDPRQTELLIKLLKEEMDRNRNLEVPPHPPRGKASVPTYPAGASIPAPSRSQPYTNVIPRADQMNRFGYHRTMNSHPVPQHYPADLIDMNHRNNRFFYPVPLEAVDYGYGIRYDQNVHPRSPGHSKLVSRTPQYEPRYGTVRDGRDVRTGYGMPRGPPGRNYSKPEEEPEDHELEIMNNIPYRLRPIPLTGPRFIR